MATRRGTATETAEREPVIDINDSTRAIDAVSRNQIAEQVMTAKRFPRDEDACMAKLLKMVTKSHEVAASCIYAFPRGGKIIEGESVRFAEMLAYCWKNFVAGGQAVGRGEDAVSCVGAAWDLESNTHIYAGIKRRITTSEGKRYDDDMIVMTENAGSSIARRNATLQCIPEALWKPAWEAARRMAVGSNIPIERRRENAIKAFQQMGVMPERILAFAKVDKVEDLTAEHLFTLSGLFTGIRDGMTTIEAVFGDPNEPINATATNVREGDTLVELFAAIATVDGDLAKNIEATMAALGMRPAARLQKLVEFKGRPGELLVALEKMQAEREGRDAEGKTTDTKPAAETKPAATESKPTAHETPAPEQQAGAFVDALDEQQARFHQESLSDPKPPAPTGGRDKLRGLRGFKKGSTL